MNTTPPAASLVYRVDEVARMLGLSRNSTYEAVHRGELPSLTFGKRVVIPKAAFDEMLADLTRLTKPKKETA